jgi:small-conductance mechanosensitive channel
MAILSSLQEDIGVKRYTSWSIVTHSKPCVRIHNNSLINNNNKNNNNHNKLSSLETIVYYINKQIGLITN